MWNLIHLPVVHDPADSERAAPRSPGAFGEPSTIRVVSEGTVPSAFSHGVTVADIDHALANYVRIYDDGGKVAMFIGPARDGTVLEIGVVLDDEDPRVIHAMTVRMKYWP